MLDGVVDKPVQCRKMLLCEGPLLEALVQVWRNIAVFISDSFSDLSFTKNCVKLPKNANDRHAMRLARFPEACFLIKYALDAVALGSDHLHN